MAKYAVIEYLKSSELLILLTDTQLSPSTKLQKSKLFNNKKSTVKKMLLITDIKKKQDETRLDDLLLFPSAKLTLKRLTNPLPIPKSENASARLKVLINNHKPNLSTPISLNTIGLHTTKNSTVMTFANIETPADNKIPLYLLLDSLIAILYFLITDH